MVWVWLLSSSNQRCRSDIPGLGLRNILLTMRQNSAWRGPLALQCLPALIVLGAMKWLPESPRYLIQTGRHEQARIVLAKLHESDEAAIEYAQIETQLRIDSSLPNTWLSLLTKKSYRKRALFALGLACGIQFTGVLVINSMNRSDTFPIRANWFCRLRIYHIWWTRFQRRGCLIVPGRLQYSCVWLWTHCNVDY